MPSIKSSRASQAQSPRLDIKDIAARAIPYLEAICAHWLPDGVRKGHDWVAPNPTRADQHAGSFSVSLLTGGSIDFATGEQTHDIVSTIKYLNGLATQLEAARVVAEFFHAIPLPDIPPHTQKAKKTASKPMRSRPVAHYKLGKPSATWQYRNAEGRILCEVWRFNTAKGKEFRPLTQTAEGWHWKAPPEPRPLYGLDRLAARPDAVVILAEGEKAADAAAVLFPECVHIASMNGAMSPNKSDWSPLAGRRVLIWPDADQPGASFAQTAARLMLRAGAASVEVADMQSLTDIRAAALPEGWDAADALAEDWRSEMATNVHWIEFGADSADSAVSQCCNNRPESRANAGSVASAAFFDELSSSASPAAIITAAIEATPEDAGAAYTPEALDAWAALYGTDMPEYMRLRERAKKAGVRLKELEAALRIRNKYAKKERREQKNNPSVVHPYTNNTFNTDKGFKAFSNSTNPTSNSTNSTESSITDAYRALVVDTEKGPRLAVDSHAAQTLMPFMRGKFAHCSTANVWHQFTGSHWEPLATTAKLYKWVSDWMFDATAELGFKARYQDAVLTVVQRAGMAALPEPKSDEIPFQNGMLDITTRTLTPITPENAATWSLPYDYQPAADCPRVKAWLWQAVDGDAEVVELLRAFLAALLRGGAHFQRFLHLIGPGGTGKSTFLRLVEALVGTHQTVSTKLQELEQNRFEAAMLYGKRAALITDSDRYGGSVNTLKAITGQDPVRLERKNVQQAGSFIFDGLVFLASNEALATTDYTSGLERRRVTVHFERRVTEEEKMLWNAQGGEHAVLHAELPGVVNWALSMPVEEMERRIRNPPEHTVKANLEAMCAGNPAADWLTECCIPDASAWTQIGVAQERRNASDGETYYLHADSRLFPNYLDWCKKSGRVPLSLRRFKSVVLDAVQTLGYHATDKRLAPGAGIQGLKLCQPYETPFEWYRKPQAITQLPVPVDPIAETTSPAPMSDAVTPEITPPVREIVGCIPPPPTSASPAEHLAYLDAIGKLDPNLLLDYLRAHGFAVEPQHSHSTDNTQSSDPMHRPTSNVNGFNHHSRLEESEGIHTPARRR